MTASENEHRLCVRGQQAGDLASMSGWLGQTGVAPDLGGGEGEWLILADAASGAPLACARLVEQLGMRTPRFSYHVGRVVHAAAELGLFRTQTTLLLGNDHSGESELADLACAPGLPAEVQTAYLTRLIEAALQRIQAQAPRFGERLIVELAGPLDERGQAPFWQGLGLHFYAGDRQAAQAKFGDAWRSHLAALLPRQTLYLSFLSEAAQTAMGQVGAAGQSAAKALAACGFASSQHVRVDDGGPVWELRLPPKSEISR
ncbi:arginine N-succinyltransferase [Roseateles oligotrophus]|uniref:Arginine N-succinyltransferase n=1 Tax=Roseateles oligotrophus TaxID=1769250 RepID=A0ABT2YLS3_9BURK|nr:arginine N-succinyltransferase [Roseateles oligotrophus]MCV2370876.1 arginine N-succinyltransferase [Roseateles oligotrophus]